MLTVIPNLAIRHLVA